jgi:uncharacterized membrane protein
MKKKIICLSAIIVGILIVLGSLSTAVCSKDLETVTIETNLYYGKRSNKISTEVSVEEALVIKQLLINLNQAIETNDEEAIAKYETILNEKGIFGEKRQEFISKNTFSENMNLNKYSKYLKQSAGDNISNTLCYFNAIGTGGIFFTLAVRFIEAMQEIIDNASTVIEVFVLLLVLLPFLAIIYLFTHLIPFRILMPIGIVSIVNGSMSSLGLQGYKRVVVGAEDYTVNISWFTGATVNFIGSGSLAGFLFVSGFAGGVKETY